MARPSRIIVPLGALGDDLAAPASVGSSLAAGRAFPAVVAFVAGAAAPFVAALLGHHSASSSAGALFPVAAGVFLSPDLAFAEASAALAGTFDPPSGSRYWELPDGSLLEDRLDVSRWADRLRPDEADSRRDLLADYRDLRLDGRKPHRVR
jgi:hypothetical protein